MSSSAWINAAANHISRPIITLARGLDVVSTLTKIKPMRMILSVRHGRYFKPTELSNGRRAMLDMLRARPGGAVLKDAGLAELMTSINGAPTVHFDMFGCLSDIKVYDYRWRLPAGFINNEIFASRRPWLWSYNERDDQYIHVTHLAYLSKIDELSVRFARLDQKSDLAVAGDERAAWRLRTVVDPLLFGRPPLHEVQRFNVGSELSAEPIWAYAAPIASAFTNDTDPTLLLLCPALDVAIPVIHAGIGTMEQIIDALRLYAQFVDTDVRAELEKIPTWEVA